jgi:hypothetical protein
MNSKFNSTIICQLIEDALPTPEFLWNVTLINGTEFNSTFASNLYYENASSLRIIGPIKLDLTSTLDIVCHVSELIQQLPPSVYVVSVLINNLMLWWMQDFFKISSIRRL